MPARLLFRMDNVVSKGVRVKAGVVSITVPPCKADFAPTSVLERRAHVPNDVVGMDIGNGRREDIPAVLQRRKSECTEFTRDHGVIRAKCRNQQPIERPADAAGVDESVRRQRYVVGCAQSPDGAIICASCGRGCRRD